MQLKCLTLVTLLASHASAIINPYQLSTTIQDIITASNNLNSKIQTENVPLVISMTIKSGLDSIVEKVIDAIKTYDLDGQSKGTLEDDDQSMICSDLIEFASDEQTLLVSIISENDTLNGHKIEENGIGSSLSIYGGAVATMAYGIYDVVPSCANETESALSSMMEKIHEAIETYNPNPPQK